MGMFGLVFEETMNEALNEKQRELDNAYRDNEILRHQASADSELVKNLRRQITDLTAERDRLKTDVESRDISIKNLRDTNNANDSSIKSKDAIIKGHEEAQREFKKSNAAVITGLVELQRRTKTFVDAVKRYRFDRSSKLSPNKRKDLENEMDKKILEVNAELGRSPVIATSSYNEACALLNKPISS